MNLMQTVLFDIEQGRKGRDSGMKLAEDHANEVHPLWSDKALNLLKIFLKNNPGEFMAEDVRSYAAVVDFPLPPHARAWGGIIARASKMGLIKVIRIDKVKNVKAHCANANVWIANKIY